MDLFGIGPLEFVFVLLIIFLVIGPKDMADTGKKIGRTLGAVKKSDFWRSVTNITREMRDLPATLMHEAGLEDVQQELQQDAQDLRSISREFQFYRVNQIKAEKQASPTPRAESPENSAGPEIKDLTEKGANTLNQAVENG